MTNCSTVTETGEMTRYPYLQVIRGGPGSKGTLAVNQSVEKWPPGPKPGPHGEGFDALTQYD